MRGLPENEFLRRVQKLKDTLENIVGFGRPNREDYWPFGFEHESKIEDCFKRDDGLWQLKKNINQHDYGCGHCRGNIVIFIWRIEPNYCCAGQPCFSAQEVHDKFVKSETRKILLSHDGYDYVWRWAEFLYPTSNHWGLRQGPTFFEMCKDGKCLVRAEKKTEFKRKVRNFFKEATCL